MTGLVVHKVLFVAVATLAAGVCFRSARKADAPYNGDWWLGYGTGAGLLVLAVSEVVRVYRALEIAASWGVN